VGQWRFKKDILDGLKRYYGIGAETVETMLKEGENDVYFGKGHRGQDC
jgi:hypothetical protein